MNYSDIEMIQFVLVSFLLKPVRQENENLALEAERGERVTGRGGV